MSKVGEGRPKKIKTGAKASSEIENLIRKNIGIEYPIKKSTLRKDARKLGTLDDIEGTKNENIYNHIFIFEYYLFNKPNQISRESIMS